jgi:hypothetical protein
MIMSTAIPQKQQIRQAQAILELGLSSWVLDELRKRGAPAVGIKEFKTFTKPRTGGGGRPEIIWDRRQLVKVVKVRAGAKVPPKPDYVRLRQFLAEKDGAGKPLCPYSRKFVYALCASDDPFLGRPLHHEYKDAMIGKQIKKDSLYISRSDFQQYREMLENPVGKQVPVNSGTWLSSVVKKDKNRTDARTVAGIYEDRQGIWVSSDYLKEVCGIDHFLPRYWARHGHPALDREDNGDKGKLRLQAVKWPSVYRPHNGDVVVYFKPHIDRILDWRRATRPNDALPGQAGTWLADEIYSDAAGTWVTNKWIREAHSVSDLFVNTYKKKPHPNLDPGINEGKLRKQQVLRPFQWAGPKNGKKQRGGRAAIEVFFLPDVKRVFGDSDEQLLISGGRQADGKGRAPSQATGPAASAPQVLKPSVVLGQPNEPVLVNGQQKSPLPATKYRIVKALLDVWPASLTKAQLEHKAHYSVPHKVISEMRKSDSDWASAIDQPGRGYRGGYRIV